MSQRPNCGPELERPYEVRKHVSNLRFKFLDGLTYRRPLWKRYLDGHLDLHLFISCGGVEALAWVKAGPWIQGADEFAGEDVPAGCVEDDEFSMLIAVGDVPETARPVNSLVRLDTFDQADMAG